MDGGGCRLKLRASKTRKSKVIFLDEIAWQQVSEFKSQREQWLKAEYFRLEVKQRTKPDEGYAWRKTMLLKRREKFLFTFSSETALRHRISKMKKVKEFEDIPNLQEFTSHDIRRLSIRSIYKTKGIEAAQ